MNEIQAQQHSICNEHCIFLLQYINLVDQPHEQQILIIQQTLLRYELLAVNITIE